MVPGKSGDKSQSGVYLVGVVTKCWGYPGKSGEQVSGIPNKSSGFR